MTLVKQNFKYENLSLDFYSCFHPVSGEIWFDGVRVAKSLGIIKYKISLSKIQNTFKCSWEKLIRDIQEGYTIKSPKNWQRNTTMINEHGLYRLLMVSGLPIIYIQWIQETVLPTIRRVGQVELRINTKPIETDTKSTETDTKSTEIDTIDWEKESLKLKLQLSEARNELIEVNSKLNLLQHNKNHEMEKLRLVNIKLKAMMKSLKRKFNDVIETATIATDTTILSEKDNETKMKRIQDIGSK